MKERPILFSGPMVRAILAGTKTQTRRVADLPESPLFVGLGHPSIEVDGTEEPGPERFAAWGEDWNARSPYGQPGDRLWVRETWRTEELDDDDEASGSDIGTDGVRFAADGVFRSIENTIEASERWGVTHNSTDSRKLFSRWRPSIHMPRWACRLELELTQVRVERLQDITEEDAKAEGLKGITKDGRLVKYGVPDRDGYPGTDDDGWEWQDWETTPSRAFAKLWRCINGPAAWDTNPWVWALTFKRAEAAEVAA